MSVWARRDARRFDDYRTMQTGIQCILWLTGRDGEAIPRHDFQPHGEHEASPLLLRGIGSPGLSPGLSVEAQVLLGKPPALSPSSARSCILAGAPFRAANRYGSGAVFMDWRSLAMAASTSSSFDGIAAEITVGSPAVISTSSSMRTPMPLYFSNAGFTASMNFSFSGVLGRFSSASGRK